MAKRNVAWTRTADIQFAGILEYWANRNKSNVYSKKLVRLVTERTKQLAKNPYNSKPSDFENIRIASLGNFSIYYKIEDTQIIIAAFWDFLMRLTLKRAAAPLRFWELRWQNLYQAYASIDNSALHSKKQ